MGNLGAAPSLPQLSADSSRAHLLWLHTAPVPGLWAGTHKCAPPGASAWPEAAKAAACHKTGGLNHIPRRAEEWFHPDLNLINATWNHRFESGHP